MGLLSFYNGCGDGEEVNVRVFPAGGLDVVQLNLFEGALSGSRLLGFGSICGETDVYKRQLERRVEILFPVEAPALKEKLWHILEGQLRDNKKAHILKPDGSYEKVDGRGKEPYCAQEVFCKEAQEMSCLLYTSSYGSHDSFGSRGCCGCKRSGLRCSFFVS